MAKIELREGITFPFLETEISEKLPQYKTELKKNPMAGFQYLEVKKNGFVGVWVRIHEKKNKIQFINTMPSMWARMALGGLLFIAFTYGAQNKLQKEIITTLDLN